MSKALLTVVRFYLVNRLLQSSAKGEGYSMQEVLNKTWSSQEPWAILLQQIGQVVALQLSLKGQMSF